MISCGGCIVKVVEDLACLRFGTGRTTEFHMVGARCHAKEPKVSIKNPLIICSVENKHLCVCLCV
jgi:hypothetical protein